MSEKPKKTDDVRLVVDEKTGKIRVQRKDGQPTRGGEVVTFLVTVGGPSKGVDVQVIPEKHKKAFDLLRDTPPKG